MTETNKHGLSRYIPEEIARKVRQECCFGCVICGMALYQYEHISPEFKDAHFHEPENIALLCPNHHELVTRGHLSKESIAEARLTRKNGNLTVAAAPLQVGSESYEIVIGSATFSWGACIGCIGELPLLLLLPPEESGAPSRVTAFFPTLDGGWSLAIFRNEWRVLPHTVWDVKVEGPKITIRRKAGDTLLQFRTIPPHRLEVLSLNVQTNQYSAIVDDKGLTIANATKQQTLCFGNSSNLIGVSAFVAPARVYLMAPFPASSDPPDACWRDILLNLHWEAGRRSHGSMVILPDGGPPKLLSNPDGSRSEILSLRIFEKDSGNPIILSGEAEVISLFSFGSSHCYFVPIEAQAVGAN
jgi:hypothetical protein